MKKRIIALVSVVIILLAGFAVWYHASIDFISLEPDEVLEIVVFNGNTGNTTHITDEEQISHMIENLNEIELKRDKLSVGYSGYSYKMTIYLQDGNEADGWNNFVINSESTIRKDPFFYTVSEGKIDYDYIESIAK